jgi:hypothetical protein
MNMEWKNSTKWWEKVPCCYLTLLKWYIFQIQGPQAPTNSSLMDRAPQFCRKNPNMCFASTIFFWIWSKSEIQWWGWNISPPWPSFELEQRNISPPCWSLGFIHSEPLYHSRCHSSKIQVKMINNIMREWNTLSLFYKPFHIFSIQVNFNSSLIFFMKSLY